MLLHQSKSKWTSLTLKFAEKKRVERTALAIVILNRFQCVCMPFVNSLVCVYLLSDHFSIIFFSCDFFRHLLCFYVFEVSAWNLWIMVEISLLSFYDEMSVCVSISMQMSISNEFQLDFREMLNFYFYFSSFFSFISSIRTLFRQKSHRYVFRKNQKTSHIQIFSIHKLSGEKKIPSALKHSRWFTSNE